MKTIGGFFELEIGGAGPGFHPEAASLTNGRACLTWILSQLRPEKVQVPFYSCDSILEPLNRLGIKHEFYPIDSNLLPAEDVAVRDGECLLVIDYFGLRGRCFEGLIDRLGRRLIVDNTQSFFERGKSPVWSFNSARKFFGVPDGAYLYGPNLPPRGLPRNTRIHWNHLVERRLGRQVEAYESFQESERQITDEVLGMSVISEELLSQVSYERVRERRIANYRVYESAFSGVNCLRLAPEAGAVPFCYPLLLDREIDRTLLHARGIFVPALWRDLEARAIPGFEFEKQFARRLLPLPLDHRYSDTDCSMVVDATKAIMGIS